VSRARDRDFDEYDGRKPPSWVGSQHADVEVDVTSMPEFADHITAEYQHNLAPNWQKISPEFQRSSFGVDPAFEEGFHVARRHDVALDDARALVENYASGLSALSAAARYMAQHYTGVDDLSATDLTKAQVDSAFQAGAGATSAEPGPPPPPPPPPPSQSAV
jgi:hypothetical protein